MKEWHIESDSKTSTLLVDQVTILKGSIADWREILLTLQSYFDNRKTEIIINEGQTLIPKKDYAFYSISFSDYFNSTDLLKIKKNLKQQYLAQLQLSPFYKQLVEVWDDLQEEVAFLNESTSSIKYNFDLSSFKDKIVSDQIYSDSLPSTDLSSLHDLKKSIELIEESSKDKLNIITIINPEIILKSKEIEQLIDFLKTYKKKTQLILLTNDSAIKADNILYKEQIINKLKCTNVKNLLAATIPFGFDENLYFKASNWYMSLVDNYHSKTVLLSYSSVDNLKEFIYTLCLFVLTNTPFILDAAMVPAPYDKYIAKLLDETV